MVLLASRVEMSSSQYSKVGHSTYDIGNQAQSSLCRKHTRLFHYHIYRDGSNCMGKRWQCYWRGHHMPSHLHLQVEPERELEIRRRQPKPPASQRTPDHKENSDCCSVLNWLCYKIVSQPMEGPIREQQLLCLFWASLLLLTTFYTNRGGFFARFLWKAAQNSSHHRPPELQPRDQN